MASIKVSGGRERMASAARVAIISSGSLASTARISARSAGARCAPPAQTASFLSRVARPCRRSSTTSGLRVSTGSLPQILVAEHHSTEGSRRAEGRHRFAVQCQQHCRGVGCADVKLLFGRETQSFARVHFGVQKKFVVRNHANMRACCGRNGEFQGDIRRGSNGDRRLLRGSIVGEVVPCVPRYVKTRNK